MEMTQSYAESVSLGRTDLVHEEKIHDLLLTVTYEFIGSVAKFIIVGIKANSR